MDNICQYLTTNELIMVNNICLYLQVNLLSKITLSNGHQLLDHILEPTTAPLTSTLAWPHQTCLPTKTWCIWKKALQTTYMNGYNNNLKQPLGHWYHDMTHQHWKWEWVVCPTSLTLYCHTNNAWESYQVNVYQQRYAMFNSMPNSRRCQLPTNATPATPHILEDHKMIILFLPVQPYHNPTLSPQPTLSILTQLAMPIEAWK